MAICFLNFDGCGKESVSFPWKSRLLYSLPWCQKHEMTVEIPDRNQWEKEKMKSELLTKMQDRSASTTTPPNANDRKARQLLRDKAREHENKKKTEKETKRVRFASPEHNQLSTVSNSSSAASAPHKEHILVKVPVPAHAAHFTAGPALVHSLPATVPPVTDAEEHEENNTVLFLRSENESATGTDLQPSPGVLNGTPGINIANVTNMDYRVFGQPMYRYTVGPKCCLGPYIKYVPFDTIASLSSLFTLHDLKKGVFQNLLSYALDQVYAVNFLIPKAKEGQPCVEIYRSNPFEVVKISDPSTVEDLVDSIQSVLTSSEFVPRHFK